MGEDRLRWKEIEGDRGLTETSGGSARLDSRVYKVDGSMIPVHFPTKD